MNVQNHDIDCSWQYLEPKQKIKDTEKDKIDTHSFDPKTSELSVCCVADEKFIRKMLSW